MTALVRSVLVALLVFLFALLVDAPVWAALIAGAIVQRIEIHG